MLSIHKLFIIAISFNITRLLFGLETEIDDDGASTMPSFRIVAPKFLCNDAQSNDSVPAPNEITISTQTRGGQKLTYRVEIYFVVLGKLKGQQHTLSIWKSVRQLQRKIASEKDDISLKNQISVHNSELTPGVRYTFQIVGIDEAGRESESQNFTIVYREGNKFGTEIQQDGTSVTEEVSLLLIGSETAYGDMPIIIEARSIWCMPNNDFYMKWSITPADSRTGLLNYFKIKGKLLRIPSGILKAAQTYQISVQLLNNKNDKLITKAEMRLTIMSREYSARILPEILMVGINKEIEINLILRDSDNTGGRFDVIWTCHLADGPVCEDFTPSETATQTIQFYSRGDYRISAVVNLNGVPKTLTSSIIVNPDIIAYPQILNLPTKAISAKDNFELNAIINDLVPNCYAEWVVLKADGFSYFNETQIPGGLGNITIHDVEETFLSELVDYGNDTILRAIPLKIPKQNNEWNPKWPGLVSNSKYKFRLKIACPEPIDDSKTGPRKTIESFTDVVIETNAPPEPQPMEVEPLAGESLRTIFKFTTGVAKDRPTDYPLKYVFYYAIDGFVMSLGEFYETMVTTTDLPYSPTGIQTYYQVCDSRDACSNDVPGPNITIVLVENVTDVELAFKTSFVQKNMETMNLESSFNTAIACLLTYQHFADTKYFNEMKVTIIEAIRSTIVKIQNQDVFIYSNDEILYFIKLSKKILDVIDYKEKDIYKGLLGLLDNIDEYSAAKDTAALKGRMVDLFADIRRRVRRSEKSFANQRVNQKEKNRDKIVTALDLYEKVFDDDELEVFVMRIEQEIKIFCKEIQDQTPLVYAKDYIAFEAIKTYDPLVFQNQGLVIPFDRYPGKISKFRFSPKMQFPLDGNYCFAKIFYPKRSNTNLPENEDVYEFLLYQNGDVKKYRPTRQQTEKNFLYEIPIAGVGDGKVFKCAIRTEIDGEWDYINCDTTEITANTIRCRCLNFGLFKAIEIDKGVTTSVVEPVESENVVTQSTAPSTTTIPTATDVTNLGQTASDVTKLDTITTSTVSAGSLTTIYIENGTESTTIGIPETTTLSISFIPQTSTQLVTTTSTNSSLSETTTFVLTSTRTSNVTTLEPSSLELSTIEMTTTTTKPEITTILEVPTTISLTSSPNNPTTSGNIEIVNQTTKSNIVTDGETADIKTTNVDNETTGAKIITNSTGVASDENTVASIGITSALVFVLFCGFFGLIFGVLYNKRKRKSTVQEIEILTSYIRQPSQGIRYARFYDATNMGGSGYLDDSPIN